MRIVIVGDGPAALSSVEAIREKDGACDVTLLSPEAERAYSPCFLAERLAGTVDTGRLALKGDDFYERHHVELLSGQTVGQTVRVS